MSDALSSNTIVLLNLDGNLVDSSTPKSTVTAVGAGPFYGAPCFGSASWTNAVVSRAGLRVVGNRFGYLGDWAVEGVVRLIAPTAGDMKTLFIHSPSDFTQGGIFLFVSTPSGRLFGGFGRSGVQYSAILPDALPADTWVHVVMQRRSGTLELFACAVDGSWQSQGVANNVPTAGMSSTSPDLLIGTRDLSGLNDGWVGRIDAVRVTEGSARYTSAPGPLTAGWDVDAPALFRAPAGRVAASAPLIAGFSTRGSRVQTARDVEFGGRGLVRGKTVEYVNPGTNNPYPCRVRLVRERDGQIAAERWSAADGTYAFAGVDELQSYTVVAYYEAHGKRAVISDGLTLANGKVELLP